MSHLFLNLVRWAGLQSDHHLTYMYILKITIFPWPFTCCLHQVTVVLSSWKVTKAAELANGQEEMSSSSVVLLTCCWAGLGQPWVLLPAGLLLPSDLGLPGTPWSARRPAVPWHGPGLRAVTTLSSALGRLPPFPAVLQISSKRDCLKQNLIKKRQNGNLSAVSKVLSCTPWYTVCNHLESRINCMQWGLAIWLLK